MATGSNSSEQGSTKAKKGGVNKSRTGKARQVTVEFGKPPKHLYVKVHPSPAYRQYGVPVFFDKARDTAHYVPAEMYEGDVLPERFKRACTITNVFTAALADGSFILWTINQSATKWFKAAMRAMEAATHEFVLVEAVKARSTYMIEPSDGTVPEPKWETLPTFEALLEGAFDSTIIGANDEVVARYMSGGHWEDFDGEENRKWDGDKWYEYPRYMFANESADILGICGEALDQLGVSWRFSRRNTISVARRDAVARLDQFVGPKY